MNIHLVLHDILYFIDVLLVLSLIILIAVKAKPGIAKVMLLTTWTSVIIFVVSHAVGVSVTDADLSRKILMFNLIDILLPLSSAHCVFALLGKNKAQKQVLGFMYTIAIALAATFIIHPQFFLLPSVPKLYFPNYYVPGPYYWVMLLYFFLVTTYFLIWMRRMYVISNGIEKNRIKYFFLALFLGYTIGSIDFLLIYNIPADPLWGFLFVPLSVIPYTYAALQYELMDISVVAKKAFIYAVTTAVIGLVLSVLNYANTLIADIYPHFPNVISSIIFALLAAVAVLFIWRKARESDVLKYEFINVVTHKFRTPLTSIKWISENLKETAPQDMKDDLLHIQSANDRLVELTNLLVNLAGTDDKSYEYAFSNVDVGAMLNNAVAEAKIKCDEKGITVSYTSHGQCMIFADQNKIKFVLQTLLDNAISYTPKGGKISVEISVNNSQFSGEKVWISITDTGIGIPKDEQKFIFTKFYRAQNGRKADTEGMGIGLYLSQRIVERHKGKIIAQSAGEGRGTTFVVTLPVLNSDK
ncbi:MAG TPA: ATP-binding protein [Candidatus Paceibacterota bacterium]|nr:ATP-binding protein [Candidatus Paceibacterota bacterium]